LLWISWYFIGYRLDARIAKATKIIDQLCPNFWPCCKSNKQWIRHWLIDCPFFNHIRSKVNDKILFLYNAFNRGNLTNDIVNSNNDNRNSNNSNSNNSNSNNSNSNNSNSNNSNSNNSNSNNSNSNNSNSNIIIVIVIIVIVIVMIVIVIIVIVIIVIVIIVIVFFNKHYYLKLFPSLKKYKKNWMV